MLKSLIIDDEEYAREYLEILIEKHKDLVLCGKAKNATEALALIHSTSPDIVYLDVSLPGKDGFQLLNEIDRNQYGFHLVFTTAYQEYAMKAIRENAHDFLLKPINRQEFNESVTRIIDHQYHLLKNKRLLRYRDIIYLKSQGNDVLYVCRDGEYSERNTIAHLSEKLPSNFQKVHRSYIINKYHIAQLNKRSVLMSNGELINTRDVIKLI